MERFEIEGGRPLVGTVRPAGNKNSALPMLAATLLADTPTRLRDVPDIGDVRTMLALLESLGAKVVEEGDGVVVVDPADLRPGPLDRELCARIRASLLLAGPLVARFGEVTLPPPGGDTIGRRRNDTHWHALGALGAELTEGTDGDLCLTAAGRLHGADVLLDEASVMATENALMAASLAAGTTVIRNAASEPHVQDLCHLLVAMGASISGIGSNLLVVEGAESLSGAEATISPDYMEIGSFIGLGAVTAGDLRIGPLRHDDLRMIISKFDLLGVRVVADGDHLLVPDDQTLEVRDDHGGKIPRIHEAPWPGFPADLMSIALVVATQATGTVLLHQWMFESRLYFTDRLIEMGARIIVADPHRAVITGPTPLVGARLNSPDIRAGMALLMASLCAEGRSTIANIRQIDRGYERIDEKLRALGASIVRGEG
ncbi:MAG TPA: UDP-N-acetylglucosamine 1-carboxyvinyltransferase [Acidimicrobiales bacterium]|nr:UDP-N-acetylglucosamine 1-carboxyvinyltransferase [Acidimicrobiales bacterium]